MEFSSYAFAIVVLFNLIFFITIFWEIRNPNYYRSIKVEEKEYTDVEVKTVINPCGHPMGMYIGSEMSVEHIDCDKACGTTTERGNFRPVTVTVDTFIDGERPPKTGIYCVHNTASVTECNTATSKLVSDGTGWSCQPLWPSIFGGPDGGDILVCGGKLTDGQKKYEYRLPPSIHVQPITDPYAEIDRFKCTPGEYVDGPRDYMNNEYLTLEENRFHRIRNYCAKYVANAIGIVGPMKGNSKFCNCLVTHGRLRRRKKVDKEPAIPFTFTERSGRVKREQGTDSDNTVRLPSVFQVPYACSPCVASGDLVSTEGIFNFPVMCTKSNQKYFEGIGPMDRQPCGVQGFTSASHPSCTNTWIYVGDQDMSYAFKKAVIGLSSAVL